MLLVFILLNHCVYSQSQIPTKIEATLSCFNGEYTKTNVNPRTEKWWFQLDLLQTQTVHFANCKTNFDTMMPVFNTSMIAIFDCGGDFGPYDDCGTCKPIHEEFTIPNMEPATYYILIRHYAYNTTNAPIAGNLSIETTGCISNPPTKTPSVSPSKYPTQTPTQYPTTTPTAIPTSPSVLPTHSPSNFPTKIPTLYPTSFPTTSAPTKIPTLYPTSFPTTSSPSGALVTSISPTTTPSKTIDIWIILFKLILKYILNFDPISDMEFKNFITDIIEEAIYIQLISVNAAVNDFNNSFEINMLTLKDTSNGLELDLKSSTNDYDLSNNIETILKYNLNNILSYILQELKEYLSNPNNTYNEINTKDLTIDIIDIIGNIDDTGSVNHISTTITQLSNDKISKKSNIIKDNLLIIIIISASLLCICCGIIGTFCYFQHLKSKEKILSSLRVENELELQGHHLRHLPSHELSSDTNGIETQKAIQSLSGFSSDNNIIYDCDLNTDLTNIDSNSKIIQSVNTGGDDESDLEELEQIQQTIQIQQQIWIQKQIEKQLEEQLTQQQLLSTLPAAPSEIFLDGQHTARMSLDPNGVSQLLNVDEQAEIDVYNEGANVNLEEDIEDIMGEEEQMAETAKQFKETVIKQEDVMEFKMPIIEQENVIESESVDEVLSEKNEFGFNFDPLPDAPEINMNVYQTAGELDNDNSD